MKSKPVQHLCEWLDKEIAGSPEGRRLPSISKIADTFSVSHVTVSKIISRYKVCGKLYTVAGKGIYTGQPRTPEIEPAARLSSSDRIVESIERQIFSGSIKLGEQLMPVKTACAQYHVSMSTAIAAYRILGKRGRIYKTGKSFFAGESPETHAGAVRYEAAFFAETPELTEGIFSGGFLYEAFSEMEKELLAHRLVLHFYANADFNRHAARWLRAKAFPRAIIFAQINPQFYSIIIPSIRKFLKQARPRAPETLLVGNIGSPNKDKDINVLMHGSIYTLRARLIAEHAIQRGIQSIRVFFDADRHAAIEFLQLNRIWLEAMAQNPRIKFAHCISSSTRRFSSKKFLASSLGGWKGSVEDNIRPLVESKETHVSYQDFLDTLVVGCSFKQSFETTPASSLWAFLSAIEASDALQWCRQHRIAVPKKVSIISQDNNSLCVSQGISSCIDDWRTIGYQMAHSLIGDFPVARTRRGYLRLQARFLGRNTTG